MSEEREDAAVREAVAEAFDLMRTEGGRNCYRGEWVEVAARHAYRKGREEGKAERDEVSAYRDTCTNNGIPGGSHVALDTALKEARQLITRLREENGRLRDRCNQLEADRDAALITIRETADENDELRKRRDALYCQLIDANRIIEHFVQNNPEQALAELADRKGVGRE